MDHAYLRRHGAASCAYDSAVSRSASARHSSLYFAKAGAKKCTCATWKGECDTWREEVHLRHVEGRV